jgi:23S rRNA (guanine745-N1)-methyltransferase
VLEGGGGGGYSVPAVPRGAGAAAAAEAHGLDISTAAVDLAARRYPAATWVVANADRDLPYAAGSFDLALALTARLHPVELRRVLAPSGCLLIAVPGDDDLVELRAAVLGRGELRDRLQPAVAALAADFELVHRARAAAVLRLPPDGLRDLLAATYRGARERQRPLAAALGDLAVTVSRDLAAFRPRPR